MLKDRYLVILGAIWMLKTGNIRERQMTPPIQSLKLLAPNTIATEQ